MHYKFIMNIYRCCILMLCFKNKVWTSYPRSDDVVLSQIVQDYGNMCPNIDLCHVRNDSATTNETYSSLDTSTTGNTRSNDYYSGGFGFSMPCCSPCSCEDNCGFNCCPDMLEVAMTKQEFESAKYPHLDCVYPQLRTYSTGKYNAPKAYRFISGCPVSYTNDNVKDKCVKHFWEFDFNDPLQHLLPRTSIVSEINYKNYFCWLCNAEIDEDIVLPWDPVLQCSGSYVGDFIKTTEDVVKIAMLNKYCNLIFNVPDTLSLSESKCSHQINQCNETGLWSTYDRFLEEACLSYTAPYHEMYKNVHCFLCNGNDRIDVKEECDSPTQSGRPSFIALLDFNDLETHNDKGGVSLTSTCPDQARFDTISVS